MWLIEQAVRQGGSGRRRPADTALSWRNYAENTIAARMPSGANFSRWATGSSIVRHTVGPLALERTRFRIRKTHIEIPCVTVVSVVTIRGFLSVGLDSLAV